MQKVTFGRNFGAFLFCTSGGTAVRDNVLYMKIECNETKKSKIKSILANILVLRKNPIKSLSLVRRT